MADTKISDLDAAAALAGTEPLPVVQAGATKRSTPAAMLAYIRALLNDADVPAAVITEAGSSRAIALTDRGGYIRFTATGAKTCTFGVAVGDDPGEYHIRNAAASGDVTLQEDSSTTLNPPAGGTLVLEPGMTVTVKRVAADEFDVFGQTTAV
jgi:hypothetical protein